MAIVVADEVYSTIPVDDALARAAEADLGLLFLAVVGLGLAKASAVDVDVDDDDSVSVDSEEAVHAAPPSTAAEECSTI